jgi:glycosyltransferase involved in cell wall biosynthesis
MAGGDCDAISRQLDVAQPRPSLPIAPPRVPDVGLLALPPDRWGGYWGSRHHVLTRLASWFHVVWVDPAREWRELWPTRSFPADPAAEAPPEIPGFSRYAPPRWLPLFYRPQRLAQLTTRARWRQARRMLERRGCDSIVLDLWKPYSIDALDEVPHDMACYHITDEYAYSPVELPIDPLERDLISRVDQVFILSRSSWAKKAHLNAHSLRLGNGVDYTAFSEARPEPTDLAAIPRPRIGYVGSLKEHLDFELLFELASRRPDWSFVLVGPERYLGGKTAQLASLRALANVHCLGPRPPARLPAYVQHMDVCMLCYVVNGYTKFVSPLKLGEYLATGRPIVGSMLPEFEELSDVIALARSPDEWCAALERALGPGESRLQRVEARRGLARSRDWSLLVERVAGAICERLGASHRQRFEAARAADPPA